MARGENRAASCHIPVRGGNRHAAKSPEPARTTAHDRRRRDAFVDTLDEAGAGVGPEQRSTPVILGAQHRHDPERVQHEADAAHDDHADRLTCVPSCSTWLRTPRLPPGWPQQCHHLDHRRFLLARPRSRAGDGRGHRLSRSPSPRRGGLSRHAGSAPPPEESIAQGHGGADDQRRAQVHGPDLVAGAAVVADRHAIAAGHRDDPPRAVLRLAPVNVTGARRPAR